MFWFFIIDSILFNANPCDDNHTHIERLFEFLFLLKILIIFNAVFSTLFVLPPHLHSSFKCYDNVSIGSYVNIINVASSLLLVLLLLFKFSHRFASFAMACLGQPFNMCVCRCCPFITLQAFTSFVLFIDLINYFVLLMHDSLPSLSCLSLTNNNDDGYGDGDNDVDNDNDE